jgi:hypothetical protein
MTYKIGITTYDEWNMLWETHVGTNDEKKDLLYSVWGFSEEDSFQKAKDLLEKLENNLEVS